MQHAHNDLVFNTTACRTLTVTTLSTSRAVIGKINTLIVYHVTSCAMRDAIVRFTFRAICSDSNNAGAVALSRYCRRDLTNQKTCLNSHRQEPRARTVHTTRHKITGARPRIVAAAPWRLARRRIYLWQLAAVQPAHVSGGQRGRVAGGAWLAARGSSHERLHDSQSVLHVCVWCT